jgi:hypothetical protein
VGNGIVDSTSYETVYASHYFLWRARRKVEPNLRLSDLPILWPKLTLICHQQTHLIVGVHVGQSPSQDYPGFACVLRQASRLVHFDRVLADAAYDGESNHVVCHQELKIRSCIIPARRFVKRRNRMMGKYRRQMLLHFPRRIYKQRCQVESVISRNKRRLGAHIRARRWFSQKRECLLKVITHNLMILAVYARNQP